MKIIDSILQSSAFADHPPVLVDVGASGEIHAKWRAIAPYAICLAFDADERDFKVNEKTDTRFKKLISFNRIVTSGSDKNPAFYLTASPYCSSLLKPDVKMLQPWFFSDLFIVEKISSLPAITISQALNSAGIRYIDWFKTDTQGTDLRLFKDLPEELVAGLLAAEFEPGIMDAYEGEDKLYSVMEDLHRSRFWLSSLDVKGTQRLKKEYVTKFGISLIKRGIRISPCWAEVTYLRQPFQGTHRQLLLMIVFALIEKQFGFALEIADQGMSLYPDGSFEKYRNDIILKIKTQGWKIPFVIFKRQFNKLLSGIND